MSLKKEEAEWDMAQKQYRMESRRKAEQNEFRARKKNVKRKRDKVQTHHLLRLRLMMKEVMMHILVIMMRIVMIMMKVIVMV